MPGTVQPPEILFGCPFSASPNPPTQGHKELIIWGEGQGLHSCVMVGKEVLTDTLGDIPNADLAAGSCAATAGGRGQDLQAGG